MGPALLLHQAGLRKGQGLHAGRRQRFAGRRHIGNRHFILQKRVGQKPAAGKRAKDGANALEAAALLLYDGRNSKVYRRQRRSPARSIQGRGAQGIPAKGNHRRDAQRASQLACVQDGQRRALLHL